MGLPVTVVVNFRRHVILEMKKKTFLFTGKMNQRIHGSSGSEKEPTAQLRQLVCLILDHLLP